MPELEIRCNGCKLPPEEIGEYIAAAQADTTEDETWTPTTWMQSEEGTYNPVNGHFLCTRCYLIAGAPTSPTGWKAP